MKQFTLLDEKNDIVARLSILNDLLTRYPNLHDEYKEQLQREMRFKKGILAHIELTLKLEGENNGKD